MKGKQWKVSVSRRTAQLGLARGGVAARQALVVRLSRRAPGGEWAERCRAEIFVLDGLPVLGSERFDAHASPEDRRQIRESATRSAAGRHGAMAGVRGARRGNDSSSRHLLALLHAERFGEEAADDLA